ncbi:PH domain-containing protein [Desertibacillus haloalkaliphilus]|uniref:PH domain-containing protein n=1 Tax=Desertibacillus haloalkaliphilus TaxID=1328930 RepID=UPI001C2764A3|nr:PH domain-containing protein [Desertibacillus haloalkaliphilus]MBU8907318.1 PH domain-containing protein [Desertibacillus haloalkaliphilus]
MRAEPRQRISKHALPVWRFKAVIESVVIALVVVGYGFISYFLQLPTSLLVFIIIVFVLGSLIHIFVVPNIRWKRWRYDVLESEIDLQYGIIIVKRTLIPMNRVQHVDTEHGPLLRKYGLAAVTISTAATVHQIPALTHEVADDLRDRIASLAAVAEDDE